MNSENTNQSRPASADNAPRTNHADGGRTKAEKTVVILGGNGYIGKELVRQWLERDPTAHFLLISRNGNNPFADKRVTAASADATDPTSIELALPTHVDCMVCLVGGMESAEQNIAPVKAMITVANERDIPDLGYVGGTLGGKVFTQSKAGACDLLRKSGKHVTIVEPTLVYGAGRNDGMAKMVPLLKFFGIFAKGVRPVRVEDVASQLIDGLDGNGHARARTRTA